MQRAAALLEPDVCTELLGRLRVSRNIAMRAFGLEPNNGGAHHQFKKSLHATPQLADRLPGETKLHFRTDVICELLLAKL